MPSISSSQSGFSKNTQNPRIQTNTSQNALGRAVPHINPAKPPKRYFQPDEDEEGPRFDQGQAASQSNPQNPAKRRKTSEEGNEQPAARPTMAPPIRLSNMRKVCNECDLAPAPKLTSVIGRPEQVQPQLYEPARSLSSRSLRI